MKNSNLICLMNFQLDTMIHMFLTFQMLHCSYNKYDLNKNLRNLFNNNYNKNNNKYYDLVLSWMKLSFQKSESFR